MPREVAIQFGTVIEVEDFRGKRDLVVDSIRAEVEPESFTALPITGIDPLLFGFPGTFKPSEILEVRETPIGREEMLKALMDSFPQFSREYLEEKIGKYIGAGVRIIEIGE